MDPIKSFARGTNLLMPPLGLVTIRMDQIESFARGTNLLMPPLGLVTTEEMPGRQAPILVPIKTTAKSGRRPVKVVNSGVSKSTAPQIEEMSRRQAPILVPIKKAAKSGRRPVKVVNSGVSKSTAPQMDPVDSHALSKPSTPTGEFYDTSTFCVASRSISPRTPTTLQTPGRSPTARPSPTAGRSPTAEYEPPPAFDLTGLHASDLDDDFEPEF